MTQSYCVIWKDLGEKMGEFDNLVRKAQQTKVWFFLQKF